jgi:RNA polymerase sigma-70 factor (ECF subfamily)
LSTDLTYTEDDQRMIRLQDGDTQVFSEIVLLWKGPLFGFFLRNTRDEHLAEDLVQETLLRLYRSCWDYLPRGLFKGFLFRIARNLLIDQSRRATNDVLIRSLRSRPSGRDGEELDPLSLISGDEPSAEDQAIQREVNLAVQAILVTLPEEQRQTFVLHQYQSLTLPEVADAMHTSLPTAKSRLRLAREKLRHLLTCRGYADELVDQSVPLEPELA